jgi:hypothetical protein
MLNQEKSESLNNKYDGLTRIIDEQKSIINELNNSGWLKFKMDELFFHKYEVARNLMLQKVSERDDVLFQIATRNLELGIDKEE